MRTRILVGSSTYCNITTPSICIDIKLMPDLSACASLRVTAQKWRREASTLIKRAELAEEAAAQLESCKKEK